VNDLTSGPEDFGFAFPDGFKWAKDMSREDLLQVIMFMRNDRERQRQSFNDFQNMSMESFS
jgi:hypothetical protein